MCPLWLKGRGRRQWYDWFGRHGIGFCLGVFVLRLSSSFLNGDEEELRNVCNAPFFSCSGAWLGFSFVKGMCIMKLFGDSPLSILIMPA